jgi:hypothetical protein
MTNLVHDTLFSRHFMGLKILSTLYVLGIIVSHKAFGSMAVWEIAVFFSIAMNFTYPWAALKQEDKFGTEATVSTILILLSIAGLFISPIFVIIAIFGHGAWDLAKSNGTGTPFFSWYVSGCVVVDWVYAASLLIFYFSL